MSKHQFTVYELLKFAQRVSPSGELSLRNELSYIALVHFDSVHFQDSARCFELKLGLYKRRFNHSLIN